MADSPRNGPRTRIADPTPASAVAAAALIAACSSVDTAPPVQPGLPQGPAQTQSAEELGFRVVVHPDSPLAGQTISRDMFFKILTGGVTGVGGPLAPIHNEHLAANVCEQISRQSARKCTYIMSRGGDVIEVGGNEVETRGWAMFETLSPEDVLERVALNIGAITYVSSNTGTEGLGIVNVE